MIKQVAKALREELQKIGYGVGTINADQLSDALSRAAIEAMREPTAAMLMAAAPFPLHLVIERADADYTSSMEAATTADRMAARSQWQTMIDAAMARS